MVFGKKDHLVGLDIGSRSLKAAEIEDSKRGRNLKRFGITEVPPGAIEDGTINDPEAVAESIRQLLKAYNIKERNAAISIGGYSVIVKKIAVQTMDEQQLQDTIHFEAEQYIPFDISDVNLDFQILGENESNPSQMNVFLVAAKKEMVNDYVNLANLAGLNPCIVDVEAFALQNTFEVNYDASNENVALIDIGASKTSLNILKGTSSVFMRDVSLGCSQINQKIVSLIDCSYDEAEQLKYGQDTDRISAEDLIGALKFGAPWIFSTPLTPMTRSKRLFSAAAVPISTNFVNCWPLKHPLK
jgi:type IV pilus assembly protein PilM